MTNGRIQVRAQMKGESCPSVERPEAEMPFPSARYFQIHFDDLTERMSEIARTLAELKLQLAAFRREMEQMKQAETDLGILGTSRPVREPGASVER